MKFENKFPVLEHISQEMRMVINVNQEGLPPCPPIDDIVTMRQYYSLERQFWNVDGPEMEIQDNLVATRYGKVRVRLYYPQNDTKATLFYLHGGGFILGNLQTHERIMRLLANYTQCCVIGIDYTLSPEARFPQAIEEIIDVCQFFHEHANEYQLNMSKIGFAGDSAGAMLSLASTLWLRDHQINCGEVVGVLLWYGLYGLQDSVSRRMMGGDWDGLSHQDLKMYENTYLRNPEDRESPYYCLFNNDLTCNVPPCFIATAEFDPLIDDSKLLHKTLQAHQQLSEYKMYPGTLHAFLHYSRMMTIAGDALQDGANFFKEQLEKSS